MSLTMGIFLLIGTWLVVAAAMLWGVAHRAPPPSAPSAADQGCIRGTAARSPPRQRALTRHCITTFADNAGICRCVLQSRRRWRSGQSGFACSASRRSRARRDMMLSTSIAVENAIAAYT